MKKIVTIIMAVLMLTAVFAGCAKTVDKPVTPAKPQEPQQPDEPQKNEEPSEVIGDVAVNIEGVVEEVDGNRIKLDSGKWVIITDKTVYGDGQNDGSDISREFAVGNLVVGFTEDDAKSSEVTAYAIYTNQPTKNTAMVIVNFRWRCGRNRRQPRQA